MPALGSAPRDGPAAGVLTVQFRGRREKVKVATVATTLQTVVDDACALFGAKLGLELNPQRTHLTHRGKKLDASLPFRFTGLVNNALLDLHTTGVREASSSSAANDADAAPAADVATPAPAPRAAAAPALGTVHVQIRFPNGKAFRGKFPPDSTLAAILESASADAAIGPALAANVSEILFLQNKVSHDALAQTTLRALGLSSGSAALRANVSKTENSNDSGATSASSQRQASNPEEKAPAAESDSQPMDTTNADDDNNATKTTNDQMDTSLEDEEEDVRPKPAAHADAIAAAVTGIRNTYFDEDSRTIAQTLLKIIATVIRRPTDERVRRINQSNATFQQKVGKYAAALEVLRAVGFTSQRGFWVLPESATGPVSQGGNGDALLRQAVDKLGQLALEVGCSPYEVSALSQLPAPVSAEEKQQRETELAADFDPYKTNLTRLTPQLPVKPGDSTVERELADLRAARDKIIADAGTPARRTRVFRPEGGFNARNFSEHLQGTSASASGTVQSAGRSDLGLIAAAAKARQQQRAAEEKFSTRAMRELEAMRKAKVYTSALLRIQLPDRVIVQAYFSPREKIAAVCAVIAEVLTEPLRDQFELYVSPPQRTLVTSKTIENEGLVPAALVHLRWKTPDAPQEYLADSACLVTSSTKEEEVTAEAKMDIDTPVLPTSHSVVGEAKQQAQGDAAAVASAQGSATGASAAGAAFGEDGARTKTPGKPKWMKLK
ncbi:UBX domain-containing protein 6 [Hondaea fermentalgiana]|uniref:UBX domain-containing protein 6 n=1 Tax=Hondaea fermentalgiana TaxID=2315210 RepID=A0A2R5GU07_9STRA|nr:UBX domain-containing protein 6 [Hondaea fermentalgiana]|eukprot:GBG34045.1 UBX domain-containing protein 6 [Hondaea fermentalgiana]